jgi:hypothetical protein
VDKLLIILFVPLLLLSCSNKKDKKVVASVNEKKLFLSEILENMPNHLEDSIYFVEKFMNDWIRKELMTSYAEINLSTDLLKYEKQIEDYKSSLLIYAYQQELLNQNFDTIITFSEIKDYYQQYKDEFKLSKSIYRGRFIVVDKSAPNLKKLNKWYKSEKDNSIENIEDYCQQFAKEYEIDCNKWKDFSIINDKLPTTITDVEDFLKNTKSAFFDNDNFRYYIFIQDYKIRGNISPLSFEKEKIRSVLLNKNKVAYLKKVEDELYQNDLSKKKIKIY